MLVELSVVEQRYLAVREALDTGATITDIARRYGVDRRTVHRWLNRPGSGRDFQALISSWTVEA